MRSEVQILPDPPNFALDSFLERLMCMRTLRLSKKLPSTKFLLLKKAGVGIFLRRVFFVDKAEPHHGKKTGKKVLRGIFFVRGHCAPERTKEHTHVCD